MEKKLMEEREERAGKTKKMGKLGGRTGREPQEWAKRFQLAKDSLYLLEDQQETIDS